MGSRLLFYNIHPHYKSAWPSIQSYSLLYFTYFNSGAKLNGKWCDMFVEKREREREREKHKREERWTNTHVPETGQPLCVPFHVSMTIMTVSHKNSFIQYAWKILRLSFSNVCERCYILWTQTFTHALFMLCYILIGRKSTSRLFFSLSLHTHTHTHSLS